MKFWVFFCASLILTVGIACLGAPTGNETGPTVQEEAGNSPGLAGVEWPISLRVTRVLEHDQLEGEPEPASSIEDRLEASTFEFYEDGTFLYNTTRGVRTLYPVQGQYRAKANGLVFSGSKTHSYGNAGESSVSVKGEVDLNVSDGGLVASVLVTEKITASTSAYGGARSTNKTSAYSGNLLLEPVK